MVLNVLIIVVTFLAMEFVAWFSHKYIMHGFMWRFHRDHHDHDHTSFFEKNDVFFLIFAVPSWLCIMFGMIDGNDYKLYIGIGILLYGIAYFIVHEMIIHQRFKWLTGSTGKYVKAIKRAHKIHHKKMDKVGGQNFGMLLVPFKYFR